jgi:hypothetical protein
MKTKTKTATTRCEGERCLRNDDDALLSDVCDEDDDEDDARFTLNTEPLSPSSLDRRRSTTRAVVPRFVSIDQRNQQ